MAPKSATDCFRIGTIAGIVETYYSWDEQEEAIDGIGWKNFGG